jgi:hypothetical protein
LGMENEVDGLLFNVFGEASVRHGKGWKRGGTDSTTEPTTPTLSRHEKIRQQCPAWNPYHHSHDVEQ